MEAYTGRDRMRDAGLPRRALCGVPLGTERQPVVGSAGVDGAAGGVRRWKAIATKGPWLLVPLLVTVLVVSGAPRSRVVREPPALPAHRSVQLLDDASRAADADGRWEAFLEVGDAARRIGAVAGSPETFDAKAREIYRSALARARQQESLDGVLRVAEALALLGDREGLKDSLRIAKVLAGGDPEAQADVRTVAAQFTDSRC